MSLRVFEVALVGHSAEKQQQSSEREFIYLSSATATVKYSISARAVPGHADKETAVVAKVGRPPVLRVGHQGAQILLDGLEVEALEGGRVVKVFAQGIRHGGVLSEDVKPDSFGPPISVPGATAANILKLVDWTLALCHDDDGGVGSVFVQFNSIPFLIQFFSALSTCRPMKQNKKRAGEEKRVAAVGEVQGKSVNPGFSPREMSPLLLRNGCTDHWPRLLVTQC